MRQYPIQSHQPCQYVDWTKLAASLIDLQCQPREPDHAGMTTCHNFKFAMIAGGVTEVNQTIFFSIDLLGHRSQPTNGGHQSNCNYVYTTANVCNAIHHFQYIHICVLQVLASVIMLLYTNINTGTISNAVWQLPVTALEKVLATGHNDTSHEWTEGAPTPYIQSLSATATHRSYCSCMWTE